MLNQSRKEKLLSPDELRPFQNHSTQMAALDYMVSLASDVFIPSYDGNMARVVEGHRRSAYSVSDEKNYLSLSLWFITKKIDFMWTLNSFNEKAVSAFMIS
jgi:hypothetical protein